MKAVLIRPSNPTGSGYLTEWGFLPTPLGLLQLAGCLLTLDNSEVKVVDMEADQMQVNRAVDEALHFNPDMVGVTIHFNVALGVVAAAASVLRGKRYVYGTEDEKLEIATPIVKTPKRADPLPNSDEVAQNDPGQTETRSKAQKNSK